LPDKLLNKEGLHKPELMKMQGEIKVNRWIQVKLPDQFSFHRSQHFSDANLFGSFGHQQ
jgi:hypothetical protein